MNVRGWIVVVVVAWAGASTAWAQSLSEQGSPKQGSSKQGSSKQGSSEREAFEAEVRAQLAATDPQAASLFQEGYEASRAGDFATAEARYRAVTERVPGNSHAWRRLCGEELGRGDLAAARTHCEKALDLEPSPHNQAMLARVLSAGDGPRGGDLMRAERLAESAVEARPDADWARFAALEVYLTQGNVSAARGAARRLQTLAPDEPATWFYSAVAEASSEEWALARRHVERARALGLPDEAADELLGRIDEAAPFYAGLWSPTWKVGLGWLGGMLLLMLLGAVLSRATTRAARHLPTTRDGSAQGTSAWVRRCYAGVLWLVCGYYYISIPLVLLAVVAVFGGVLYGFFAIGHIPIKLALIVLVVGLVTVWAIVKSFFVRAKDEDPGERLDLAEHPRLRDTLSEVAEEVGTEPVHTVFLTPGTDIAVFERGGLLKQLRGATERCLILGVAVLDGMDLRSFKAILAHEYGHFVNRDTAGGGFALAVRRSLVTAAIGLMEGGAAAWYNPAWWFLNGFHKIFLRISHGASRLQEVLADRWAAFAYGARAFERGLRHVVAQSVRFDAHANTALREAVEGQKALVNLYRADLDQPLSEDEIDGAIAEALERQASEYDSHPAPLERFELVHALGIDEAPHPDDDVGVWSLFSNREALELRMTEELRHNVFVNTGIHIDGQAADGPDRSAA